MDHDVTTRLAEAFRHVDQLEVGELFQRHFANFTTFEDTSNALSGKVF